MFTKLIEKEAKFKKANEYAQAKGGECLSEEYVYSRGRLEWKCKKKTHDSWLATYDSVVNHGSWCRKCANEKNAENYKNKNALDLAKKYAQSKGGECLSTEYINTKTKLEWKCSNSEHESWVADFEHIVKRNSWCPKCSGRFSKNEQLEKAKKLALNKNGLCLSNLFKTVDDKLIWKCSNSEHESWEATFSQVKKGSWCPKCAGFYSKEEGLIRAANYVESKGGKCLSEKYIKAQNLLTWQCAEKHTWDATYASVVLNGSWCPICSVYYYKEHVVREILEYLLGIKLEKEKPIWNINPKTKKRLELDGYNTKSRIAFEFQGKQHYEDGVFYNDEIKFSEIQYRDEVKLLNCEKNGVILLIIDDNFSLKQQEEFLDYILCVIKEKKLKTIKNIDKNKIKQIFEKTFNHQENKLLKAKEYAKSKNGECLSIKYFFAREKLEWKCKENNHNSWFSTYDSVVNHGSWCPECAGFHSKEEGLLRAKKLAELKNGECLSTEYKNAKTKLFWKCEKEHVWEARVDHVRNGHWCPCCYKERIKNLI